MSIESVMLRIHGKRELRLGTRITPEQHQILIVKTKAAGYSKVADYVRSVLFRSISSEEKINQIWEQVCKNG